MRKAFLFVLTLIISTFAISLINAQDLVSSVRNGAMTVSHANQRMNTIFGANVLTPAANPIELYKLTYRSKDEKGRAVILSGLLAYPNNGAPKGLVVFNHGTIADRKNSPSFFKGAANSSEAEQAILAFASGGYAVAIPDYLGLGDHKAAHPYPLGEINSHSAVDMIVPARLLANRLRISIGSKLFVTGYSEGGAVGMWAVRNLEQKSDVDYSVSAAALLSGPYDMSGVTREYLMSPNGDQTTFVIKLYLISYMAYYFHKSQGIKLTEFFKPSMAFTVSRAYADNISDEAIIKRLALAAVLMRAKNSIFNVITPQFRKAMETLDRNNPVIRELIKQDIYDWSPRTKMLLVNVKNDTVVIPTNTDKAIETMRRRGIGENSLRRYILPDAKLTHITGVGPALAQARLFFDNGFNN